MEEREIDPELVEELRQSKRKLGALSPIILDAKGNIVEGHHRQEADPDWPKVTYKEIRTEEDQVLFAIAFNWHRREKSDSWKMKMLAKLAGLGHTVDQIAEMTGLNKRTVYRYLPGDLKGSEPKELAEARLSRDNLSRNLTPHDMTVPIGTVNPQDMTVGKARELLDTPAGREVLEDAIKERKIGSGPEHIEEEEPLFAEGIQTVEEEPLEDSEKTGGGSSKPLHDGEHRHKLEGTQVGKFHCSECNQDFFIDHISADKHRLTKVGSVPE